MQPTGAAIAVSREYTGPVAAPAADLGRSANRRRGHARAVGLRLWCNATGPATRPRRRPGDDPLGHPLLPPAPAALALARPLCRVGPAAAPGRRVLRLRAALPASPGCRRRVADGLLRLVPGGPRRRAGTGLCVRHPG